MNTLTGFTLLLLLQTIGEILVRLLSLDVPGPVVGLLLLLASLPLLPALERPVGESADLLLAHLSLLFVPAGVGVIAHLGRLDGAFLGVAATILISTVAGLLVTALVLQFLLRRGGVVPVERPEAGERPTHG